MEVIPAIELLGRVAVRLEQGDYDRVTTYGEPIELAARFAAAGARWIHVVDLDGARAGLIRPVVVGTAAWTLMDELVASLGERLVVALDVRDGVVHTRGWTESGLELDEALARCVAGGVPRLLCTAIDRDGTLEGPDVGLVRRVVDRSGLPVLAAGGIRSQADLDELADAGAEGAIVGRALLDGRIQLA